MVPCQQRGAVARSVVQVPCEADSIVATPSSSRRAAFRAATSGRRRRCPQWTAERTGRSPVNPSASAAGRPAAGQVGPPVPAGQRHAVVLEEAAVGLARRASPRPPGPGRPRGPPRHAGRTARRRSPTRPRWTSTAPAGRGRSPAGGPGRWPRCRTGRGRRARGTRSGRRRSRRSPAGTPAGSLASAAPVTR